MHLLGSQNDMATIRLQCRIQSHTGWMFRLSLRHPFLQASKRILAQFQRVIPVSSPNLFNKLRKNLVFLSLQTGKNRQQCLLESGAVADIHQFESASVIKIGKDFLSRCAVQTDFSPRMPNDSGGTLQRLHIPFFIVPQSDNDSCCRRQQQNCPRYLHSPRHLPSWYRTYPQSVRFFYEVAPIHGTHSARAEYLLPSV